MEGLYTRDVKEHHLGSRTGYVSEAGGPVRHLPSWGPLRRAMWTKAAAANRKGWGRL